MADAAAVTAGTAGPERLSLAGNKQRGRRKPVLFFFFINHLRPEAINKHLQSRGDIDERGQVQLS
jgi:hypothetical protein